MGGSKFFRQLARFQPEAGFGGYARSDAVHLACRGPVIGGLSPVHRDRHGFFLDPDALRGERMLSVPRMDFESQRMLRDFGDVTVIPRGSPVPLWQPTRLNARYHAALRIASLVLDATSVEHETGNVAVNGFLLDMPLLFEQFVTVALREAITARFGGRVEGQVRYHLDQAGQVPLRPDIVWKVGGTTAAVIDAKYKAEKPAGYPNADLYQLLAYCTILGLPVGHLVYAQGNASPARHVVRQSGVEIICHAIDLRQAPGQLIGEMSNLAEVVTAMAITSCRYPV
jgi:5-methylcytosine-specific restriction enzyme subunit McrC